MRLKPFLHAFNYLIVENSNLEKSISSFYTESQEIDDGTIMKMFSFASHNLKIIAKLSIT